MFFLSDIPHLKVFRQRALLPLDKKIQTMYSVVFINNNSTQSAIDLITNPYLYHNNKFHFYYLDNLYNGKLFNKQFREVLNKERESIYEEIESKVRFINPERSFSMINNRNVYVDLQYHNDIFFRLAKRTTMFKTKVEAYINYLKKIISDKRFEKYTNKTVLTNLDCWMVPTKDKSAKGSAYENPLFITYFALYKMLEKFKELGDVNLIFYTDKMLLRLNPSLCDKNSYRLFRIEMGKLSSAIKFDSEEEMEKNLRKEEIYANIIKSFIDTYNFTGDSDTEEFENSLKQRLDEFMEQEDVKDLDGKKLEDKLTDGLINDEKTLKDIYTITQQNKVGRSTASLKRDQELREKQKEIKLKGMRLEDLRNIVSSRIAIEKMDVSDKVETTNKNMTTIKYPHFEKAYNEQLMQKDLANILSFLNEKSIPVFIRNIEVVDTSDELNLKETYTVDLEDANRVRHRLKFDMPKFIDDKFMYLNGNKKIIIKQLFMKPVVKTGPDEVQVCSNYNKIFMRRYGTKVSSKIEKFKKAIAAVKAGLVVKYGNNLAVNNKYKTTIEYDELSKDISYIKTGNAEFYFNQDEVEKLLKEKNITLKENQFCIGFVNGKTPILVDMDTQNIEGSEMDIVDYILSVHKGELVTEFEQASSGKKFIYTRATIMKKQVPLILLLGYLEGLTTVLRKAGIKHYFTDTRPRVDVDQGVVQFSNGYLVYDRKPFENSLLMNAFADIPTRAFAYEEFDEKEAYLSIFDTMFNTKIIGNAFDNFYEFMIDPITKEVLEDLDYPTDFVSLMLFANALLADNSYIKENNMNLYRVRSNELVNVFLYKAIADAYIQYRLTANNNNPVKISVPQDVVLKKILTAQTVEDYSTLNPIVELEKSRAITPKGPSGMNLDDAYTQDKRSYDKTMLGILAMSTSPDANCGIVRQLTLEPNIVSPRGYIEIKDDKLEELTDANLFSPAELLSPLGVTRDDSIRTAMATKQSKHIIPIEKSSPVLISNGSEQVIHYHLSNDFSVVAKYDGKVVEVDDDTGLVIVEYKVDKTKPGEEPKVLYQAIDTKPRTVKNGAGGFFLSNQLTCKLKKGDTFKKNDVLAYDKKFFTDSKVDGNRFNIGSLQKVACMSSYATYEDSTFITKKLSEDMAADIVMQKAIVLGKNANVDYLVKVGDEVKVGDDLIRFEMSFQDDSLNKFLSSIGDSLKEEIKSLGKTGIKSKYSGVIEDIKIYSTVELNDLSPSLRKIVKDYYDQIEKKKKLLSKYDKTESSYKCGILFNEPTGKVETKDGKVKGNEVGEGVLIEIYIKYRDVMGVGDKITFFTALKSIIGEVIPEGLEPYSEFRPEEEVSSFIAPGAVLARMTPSILLTMFANKTLVELKRALYEIYTGKKWGSGVDGKK